MNFLPGAHFRYIPGCQVVSYGIGIKIKTANYFNFPRVPSVTVFEFGKSGTDSRFLGKLLFGVWYSNFEFHGTVQNLFHLVLVR